MCPSARDVSLIDKTKDAVGKGALEIAHQAGQLALAFAVQKSIFTHSFMDL